VTDPPGHHSQLREFVERVAHTLYDGRPCTHEDGCHNHSSCTSGCRGDDPKVLCSCPRGDCCDPVQMGNDEMRDELIDLVGRARELVGLPDLYGRDEWG